MAAYGKVFDLFDDTCLDIQDVDGTRYIHPVPTLRNHSDHQKNIIVYRIGVSHAHFFGRLQEFTDTLAREQKREIWTFAVQFEVACEFDTDDDEMDTDDFDMDTDDAEMDADDFDMDIDDDESEQTEETGEDDEGALHEQPAGIPVDGDGSMVEPVLSPGPNFSNVPTNQQVSQASLQTAPNQPGPKHLPTPLNLAIPQGPPDAGWVSAQLVSAVLQCQQTQNITNGGVPSFPQSPDFDYKPSSPFGTTAGPSAATTLFPTTAAPGSMFAPTMPNVPRPGDYGPPTGGIEVSIPVHAHFMNPTLPRNVPRKFHVQLLEQGDVLRMLICIAQVSSGVVPNFIECLYRTLDKYVHPGFAAEAALAGEIPSLWEFEKLPVKNPEVTVEPKPDLDAFQRHWGHMERFQYLQDRKFGFVVPDERKINMFYFNIPEEEEKRYDYYANCYKARVKAVQLLMESGMTLEQISNYNRDTVEDPKATPNQWGPYLAALNQDLEIANMRHKSEEERRRLLIKKNETALNNRLAEQIEEWTQALARETLRLEVEGVRFIMNMESYKANPFPVVIHVPKCLLGPLTGASGPCHPVSDAMLLAYVLPSGTIVVMRAIFFTVDVSPLIKHLVRSSAVSVLESYDYRVNVNYHKDSAGFRYPHSSAYHCLAQAYAHMTRGDRQYHTKRWMTGKPLGIQRSPLGFRPPSRAIISRGSIWEGYALTIETPIQYGGQERRGAAVGHKDAIALSSGAGYGFGAETEAGEVIPVWERERRAREAEELMEEEEEQEAANAPPAGFF